ncbi:putative caspase-like protein [Roseibium hamelinense]|uniref:Putative caspase-like protein n=1 Tax=Roseibium hamelinense TaxID=150831 RepID=A0A562SXI8_9HYPH|nr:caspase family protein [Roseibium hamelinense]MTI44759.1 caspase family protein [Roseibium hamelinense]TWI86055.1 putative caspase-like protein [Roseibium hamelinense]
MRMSLFHQPVKTAFWFMLFALVFAPLQTVASERHALVIGNADYNSNTLTALKNPANDAALVADSLKTAGFKVQLVLNADLRAMKRAVRDFTETLKQAPQGSLSAFYYSGHGFEAGGRNYLAPLEADLRDEVDAEFEALSVDWVLTAVEKSHDGANIVILDACRNTALTRSAGGTAGGFSLLTSTPRGTFISFATAPGSTATDGAGLNSPYTAAIAREMLVPGATIEAVFKRVRQQVVDATGGEQVPWDHSSLTDDIVLLQGTMGGPADVASAPAGASAMQLELQFWNDVKDTDDRSEIQAYLDRFPSGAFSELAKTRLEQIGTGPSGDIEQLFARIQSRSLLVENPQRPHEFYANARLREIKGDYPKARLDYLKYFAFGEPQVDPHVRFQAVLKIQEGRAGAREVYNAFTQGRRDATTLFAGILLEDREERVRRLTSFLQAYPDFTPAYYALSQDFSAARVGQQSLADKTKELELLNEFMAGVDDGRYLRYFLDQQMAADWLEDAKTRLAALSVLNSAALVNPIKINAMRSNQGWMLNLAIADRTQEIFVKLPNSDFKSTGFMANSMDPTTGKPIAYPMVELPGNAEAMDIMVKYTDIRGEEQGPFEIRFNPNLALIAGQKDILERMPNGWVSYRDFDGKRLVYFTHLISYRCAIDEVQYGLDTDTPNQSFEIGECDPDNPHAIPSKGPGSVVYTDIPKPTKYLSVKLTYADGTQSEVQRFDAPN